jgi:protein tyrosine phosphatase
MSVLLSLDDHSRVILTPVGDDVTDDYTNANYIDVSQNFNYNP